MENLFKVVKDRRTDDPKGHRDKSLLALCHLLDTSSDSEGHEDESIIPKLDSHCRIVSSIDSAVETSILPVDSEKSTAGEDRHLIGQDCEQKVKSVDDLDIVMPKKSMSPSEVCSDNDDLAVSKDSNLEEEEQWVAQQKQNQRQSNTSEAGQSTKRVGRQTDEVPEDHNAKRIKREGSTPGNEVYGDQRVPEVAPHGCIVSSIDSAAEKSILVDSAISTTGRARQMTGQDCEQKINSVPGEKVGDGVHSLTVQESDCNLDRVLPKSTSPSEVCSDKDDLSVPKDKNLEDEEQPVAQQKQHRGRLRSNTSKAGQSAKISPSNSRDDLSPVHPAPVQAALSPPSRDETDNIVEAPDYAALFPRSDDAIIKDFLTTSYNGPPEILPIKNAVQEAQILLARLRELMQVVNGLIGNILRRDHHL